MIYQSADCWEPWKEAVGNYEYRKIWKRVMKKILKKLMVLLDKRQKRVMVLLIILMLIGAVLETAGVSMVLPVMNVVMDENAVEKHGYLQVICRIMRIDNEDTRSLMIFTMVGLIGIFVIKNILA